MAWFGSLLSFRGTTEQWHRFLSLCPVSPWFYYFFKFIAYWLIDWSIYWFIFLTLCSVVDFLIPNCSSSRFGAVFFQNSTKLTYVREPSSGLRLVSRPNSSTQTDKDEEIWTSLPSKTCSPRREICLGHGTFSACPNYFFTSTAFAGFFFRGQVPCTNFFFWLGDTSKLNRHIQVKNGWYIVLLPKMALHCNLYLMWNVIIV